MAVGEEDHRPLTVHLLQAIGVLPGLLLSDAGIDGCLLGFDDGKWFAVVVPEHVVAVPDRAGGGLIQHVDLLPDGLVAGGAGRHVPAGQAQVAIDQPLSSVVLAKVQLQGDRGPQFACLAQRFFGRRGLRRRSGLRRLFSRAQVRHLLQRLLESLLLEGVLFRQSLGLALELGLRVDAFGWRDLEVGEVCWLSGEERDMQPARELPCLMHTPASVGGLHAFAVRGAVAEFAKQVQLVQNEVVGDHAEAAAVQQVDEVGLRRPRQLQCCVDVVNHALREVAQLHQRAFGVRVRVVLRVPGHVGEFREHRAQRLKVQRSKILHPHLSGFRIGYPTSVCENLASLPSRWFRRLGASSSCQKFGSSKSPAASLQPFFSRPTASTP